VGESFIPLAAFVRSRSAPPVSSEPATGAPLVAVAADEPERPAVTFAYTDALEDLALMRLAALEGYERACTRLLESLASEVLGRELALAPADLAALLQRALAAFSEREPLAIVLAPHDAERARFPLPVRADPTLAAGDLVIEVSDSQLESRFAFRTQVALARAVGAA
jgi:flagellar biosynthesis/type III secretory pathway protein FliH